MKNRIITREELNKHLWAAADILRGTVDASEFKNHIFGLLFLKRLSDVFDEEVSAILAREKANGSNDAAAEQIAADPDEHRFFVPEESRWSYLLKVGENRAAALDTACRALEDDNAKSLEGVMGSIVFNDPNRFGDALEMDGLMQRLLIHFDKLPLGNSNLSEPDILGNAYEYLIERFAETAGKKGGEFYTPRQVVRLIVELLEPQENMRICDPTAGSGGMLIETAHYILDHTGNPRNISLYGQEKNRGTWAICKLNMLLHDLVDADIKSGDTIRAPKLIENGRLMEFDRVIANPPFSLKDWGHESAEADPWDRFKSYAVPPRTKGDFAFVLHMVATCNESGKVGVVVPHGVLFRGSKEGLIREKLLKADYVEAVVGLPVNLFFGTGIPAALLIINKAKPATRKNQVLMIDASSKGFYQDGSNQNLLRGEDILRITAVFRAWANKAELSDRVNEIKAEWRTAAEADRDRQLERIEDDKAARARVLEEATKRIEGCDQAEKAVHTWAAAEKSLEKFARAVPLQEIAENEFNLNISRYVDSSEPAPELDVAEELKKLRELEKARNEAETEMNRLLAEIGFNL